MSIGLRLDGKAIGIDPNDTTRHVYTDRDTVGLWEAVTVTPHQRWSDIKFVASNLQLCVDEVTRKLEARPAGEIYDWGGQWEIVQRDGAWYAVCDTWALAFEGYRVSVPLHLEKRGNDFIDKAGNRAALCGCDGFLDYRIWLDKGDGGLKPFMQETNDFGFTVRRVFLAGSVRQNTVLDLYPSREPDYYSKLKPFVAYQNSYGIIPLLTVNVDSQDVMPVAGDRLRHWQRVNAELRGSGLSYLMSGGNEADKNGFDPYTDIDNPGAGVIWSRGSRTQDQFYESRGASAVEFHPVRGFERCLMDAVASAVFIKNATPGMLWMDEGIPWDNGSNPTEAWQLARVYGTLWALAVFHNRQGQRGLLLQPGTARCAEAWVKGMRS